MVLSSSTITHITTMISKIFYPFKAFFGFFFGRSMRANLRLNRAFLCIATILIPTFAYLGLYVTSGIWCVNFCVYWWLIKRNHAHLKKERDTYAEFEDMAWDMAGKK